MALQIVTVCDSISKLSVAGVTIMDIDQIPENQDNLSLPVIIPRPDGFISGFEYDRKSLGPGSTAAVDIIYILTYRLLHSNVGDGVGDVFETYPAMVALTALFLDTVIAIDAFTGAVDIEPLTIANFDTVNDPYGNFFHGCDIGIKVMEFVN